MASRNGNYSAFYVSEPFNDCSLGAHATKDFVYYNMLRAWKGSDPTFPFIDSHDKTYSVRDSSDWELTLKPRIRERIRHSKNIILFLSSVTKSSKAIREEMDYGINTEGLPIIVIYPEFSEKSDIIDRSTGQFKNQVIALWDNLPIFRDSMLKVPTVHVPNKKSLIRETLNNPDFMLSTKTKATRYRYNC